MQSGQSVCPVPVSSPSTPHSVIDWVDDSQEPWCSISIVARCFTLESLLLEPNDQLVGASESDADLGFIMARLMALCSLPRAPIPATGFGMSAAQRLSSSLQTLSLRPQAQCVSLLADGIQSSRYAASCAPLRPCGVTSPLLLRLRRLVWPNRFPFRPVHTGRTSLSLINTASPFWIGPGAV